MSYYIFCLLIIGFGHTTYAMVENPYKKVISRMSVSESSDQLDKLLSQKGLKIFNRIKHSKSAEMINLKINSSELLIFGNPKVGSRLMRCNPEIGIDLPLKALVYENNQGKVMIKYTNLKYIQSHYKLGDCEKEVLNKAVHGLDALFMEITK